MKKIKAWYDDIDSATLQRIKIYSAFNDAKSKNLMCQTIYEYREKEIQDFKETNHELALESIARQKRITELEAQIEKMKNCKNCANYMISGKCPCFFRTGWCKNWEMTRSKK